MSLYYISHRIGFTTQYLENVVCLCQHITIIPINKIQWCNIAVWTADDGQNTGVRFQAVMATLYGLRTAAQTIKEDLAELRQNMTGLANVTRYVRVCVQ